MTTQTLTTHTSTHAHAPVNPTQRTPFVPMPAGFTRQQIRRLVAQMIG